MTEKIYEKNAYCSEFTGKVISCISNGDFYEVVLDKTAFFPEGGGQGADKGTLNGEEVCDVQEKGKEIVHFLRNPVSENTRVSGVLDWDVRFARMQSHTGEHIISGIVHSMFGYDNIGFHMSDSLMTVDFSGPLSAEDIAKVEEESNRAIYKNASVSVVYPDKEEADKMDFRSKIDIDNGLRVVNIDGIDSCACCAPHVNATGEVGIIKVIDFYHNKKGTRIELLAGISAVRDYAFLNSVNKGLMKMFSAKRDAVLDGAEKLNDSVQSLQNENKRLSKEVATASLKPVEAPSGVYAFLENASYDDLRFCANNLTENNKNSVLLSKSGENEYLYVVASSENRAREIATRLNSAFNGKGGGKDNYCQGKLTADDLQTLENEIKEALA